MKGLIGIVTAMSAEGHSIAGRRGWKKVDNMAVCRKKLLCGHDMICVISGIGRKSTERGTEILLESGATCFISTGISGGLDMSLPSGALILADKVIVSQGNLFHVDPLLYQRLHASIRKAGFSCHTGMLLTSIEPLLTAKSKQEAKKRTDALAVDMESAWVALKAKKHKIPFAALRAVSDRAVEDIDFNPDSILKNDGRLMTSAFLRTIIGQPKLILSFPWSAINYFKALRILKHVWKKAKFKYPY